MAVTVTEMVDLLSDPERRKLFTILLQDELCKKELKALLDQSEERLNRELQILRESNLIEIKEIDGTQFYQACANPLEEVRSIIAREESNHWNTLSKQISRIKQEGLCSLRQSVTSSREQSAPAPS
jgi:DNA-binding transcriptional ArsR family regulator